MMAEIHARGPIECMLLDSVPSFGDYDGGGMICEPSNATGRNHDVEILGWGVEEATGQKFWVGRNSWGTQWGERGWFRLCRGTNNLGVEEEGCAWVVPQ
jgi:cathepsin X